MTRALVVEDDPDVMPAVEDTIYSLGHEHHWAQSQEDAQKMLQGSQYGYVLLDLEIPAKSGRGGASVQYGLNLAEHIRASKGPGKLPILVMTGHGAKCLNMMEQLTAAGVKAFIAKPFPDAGRTLAEVIKTLLAKPVEVAASAGPSKLAPFTAEKRDLVICEDRVTLCGATVWRETQHADMRQVLIRLSRKEHGRYVRIDGRHLGRELGRNASNPVSRLIKEFRERVSVVMEEHCGLECGPEDVVGSGAGGYHLREWVETRMADTEPETQAATTVLAQAESGVSPAGPDLNGRQVWILDQLKKGAHFRLVDIVRHTKVNRSTVNRDLKELRERGMIGTHPEGYYVCTRQP